MFQESCPLKVKQSKEDLYEKALTAQIKVNELTEDNRRLQTRLQFMETQMGLQDSTGQVTALKRQIKDLRVQHVQLESQLDQMKYDMQTTSVKELRLENELLNSELIRLREMCSALMQNQSGVQSGNNKVDLTLELNQAQEKSKAFQSLLNTAKNQIAQLTLVQQDFKAQQILHEDQVKSLKSDLVDHKENTKKLISDHSNAILLQKEKHEDELRAQKQSAAKKILDLESNFNGNLQQFNEQLKSAQEERDNSQEKVERLREAQLKNIQTFKDQIKALEENLKEEKNKNKSLKETVTDLEGLNLQLEKLASQNEFKLKEAEIRYALLEKENEALKQKAAQPKQNLQPENRFSETFDRASSIVVDSRHQVSSSQLASQEIKRQTSGAKQVQSNYEQSSGSDANYRRSIDSDKVKAEVKELLNDQQSIDSRENFSEDYVDAAPEEESFNELLTAQSAPIKDALYTMKRACQVHALKFEEIDTWLFGSNYRIEQRVSMEELSSLMKEKLKLQSLQANLFSRFLVEQCSQNAGKTEKVTSNSKVLACKVVSTMMSNLNVYCNGIQHYSSAKVKKMQLIIGEHLLRQELEAKDFDDFGKTLNQFGLGKETLDCAHIHLLKLSDSYQRVNNQVLLSFIQQCRNQAKSFSATGMSFPVQEELLEYSLSEESEQKQLVQPIDNSSHQPYNNTGSLKHPQVQEIDYQEESVATDTDEDLDFERMDSGPVASPREVQKLTESRHNSQKHVHFNQDDDCDLKTAILNRSTQRIQELIDRTEVTPNFVLLQICLHSQDPELLKFVLKTADPTATDTHGKQALHYCSANEQMLQVLFKHEPQIVDLDPFDNEGETPLMKAVRDSDTRCVQLCLENSCNPFLINGNQDSVLQIAETLPEGESKAVIQHMIQSTMQEWLENLGEEGVQKSIKSGQHLNQQRQSYSGTHLLPKDETKLIGMSQKNEKEKSLQKVDDDGQLPIRRLKTTEQKNLHETIKSNDFTNFKKLIEEHYPCEDALIKVCKFGNDAKFIRLLEEFDFDINYQDSAGLTGLHHACGLGNTEFVQILLDQTNIDQDLFDNKGWTPLMYAVTSEQIETVAECLTHGCNPLLENGEQMCAMRIANNLPHIEKSLAIRVLIEDAIHSWVQNLGAEQILRSMKSFRPIVRLQSDKETTLIQAIKSNDFTNFEKLIEEHYPCEDALIKVCKFGNDAKFIRLLVEEFDFDINYEDSTGLTGLHHACGLGKTEFVSILLNHTNIDQDLFDKKGWTPLMYAVTSEQIETVAECLTHGCNPLLENGEQMCAMRIANNLPHIEKSLAIKVFIEDAIHSWVQNLGADQILRSMKSFRPIVRLKTKEEQILQQVILSNDFTNFEKLIEEHYPCEDALIKVCKFGNDAKFIRLLVEEFDFDINYEDSAGLSGLHHACGLGKTEFVSILLDHTNIDQDLFDKKGWTPLMYAVTSEQIETVAECLTHGCNPLLENGEQMCAMRIANNLPHIEKSLAIKVFIEDAIHSWVQNLGADQILRSMKSFRPIQQHLHNDSIHLKKPLSEVSSPLKKPLSGILKNQTQSTLIPHKDELREAIEKNDVLLVKKLLLEGYPPNDAYHQICLHSNDSKEMLDTVLDFGVDVNFQDLGGRSGLHHSCHAGHVDQIEILLNEEEIDVNLKDKHDDTPLMLAVLQANIKAVSLCLNHGCNPFFVNKDGESAIDYCSYLDHDEVAIQIESIIKIAMDQWLSHHKNDEEFVRQLTNLKTEEKIGTAKPVKSLKIKIDVSEKMPNKAAASVPSEAEKIPKTEEEYLSLKDKLLCAIHDDDLETVDNIIGERTFDIDDVFLWVCQYSNDYYLMLDLVLHYNPNINAHDLSGRSALHLACIGAKIQFIETLLNQDRIEKDLYDNGGETPLMYAVKSQCENAVVLCINNMCNPFQENYLQESVMDYTQKFMDKTKSAGIEGMIKDAALDWIERFSEGEIRAMMMKPKSRPHNFTTQDLA